MTSFFLKKKRENTNPKSCPNIQNIWNSLKTDDHELDKSCSKSGLKILKAILFYIMSMQKKYNYNRHLCKKIDKLEDFTVEYKNDPFKALKLFIDSYLWLKDPSKNNFPEELVGQSAIAIEKYVRNVIETTAKRWAGLAMSILFSNDENKKVIIDQILSLVPDSIKKYVQDKIDLANTVNNLQQTSNNIRKGYNEMGITKLNDKGEKAKKEFDAETEKLLKALGD